MMMADIYYVPCAQHCAKTFAITMSWSQFHGYPKMLLLLYIGEGEEELIWVQNALLIIIIKLNKLN